MSYDRTSKKTDRQTDRRTKGNYWPSRDDRVDYWLFTFYSSGTRFIVNNNKYCIAKRLSITNTYGISIIIYLLIPTTAFIFT